MSSDSVASLELRQLAVLMILTLTVGVRLVAHRLAGGLLRDQSDGLRAEGGLIPAILLRLAFLLFGLGGFVLFLVQPERLPGSIELPGWTHFLGGVLAELGLLLLIAVHLSLGVQFSGTLHLRSDHRLISAGPYASMRHPMYTSFLLLFVGLSLLIGSWMVGAILLGSQVWVLGWRLPREEHQLAERFGSEWETYKASTGALIPRLRR
ncbi:MAG: isoprenylcysteine carboxylmethyltransferase family protein [Acidobacteriota bacterium]